MQSMATDTTACYGSVDRRLQKATLADETLLASRTRKAKSVVYYTARLLRDLSLPPPLRSPAGYRRRSLSLCLSRSLAFFISALVRNLLLCLCLVLHLYIVSFCLCLSMSVCLSLFLAFSLSFALSLSGCLSVCLSVTLCLSQLSVCLSFSPIPHC